jgi:hypothetical protein
MPTGTSTNVSSRLRSRGRSAPTGYRQEKGRARGAEQEEHVAADEPQSPGCSKWRSCCAPSRSSTRTTPPLAFATLAREDRRYGPAPYLGAKPAPPGKPWYCAVGLPQKAAAADVHLRSGLRPVQPPNRLLIAWAAEVRCSSRAELQSNCQSVASAISQVATCSGARYEHHATRNVCSRSV